MEAREVHIPNSSAVSHQQVQPSLLPGAVLLLLGQTVHPHLHVDLDAVPRKLPRERPDDVPVPPLLSPRLQTVEGVAPELVQDLPARLALRVDIAAHARLPRPLLQGLPHRQAKPQPENNPQEPASEPTPPHVPPENPGPAHLLQAVPLRARQALPPALRGRRLPTARQQRLPPRGTVGPLVLRLHLALLRLRQKRLERRRQVVRVPLSAGLKHFAQQTPHRSVRRGLVPKTGVQPRAEVRKGEPLPLRTQRQPAVHRPPNELAPRRLELLSGPAKHPPGSAQESCVERRSRRRRRVGADHPHVEAKLCLHAIHKQPQGSLVGRVGTRGQLGHAHHCRHGALCPLHHDCEVATHEGRRAHHHRLPRKRAGIMHGRSRYHETLSHNLHARHRLQPRRRIGLPRAVLDRQADRPHASREQTRHPGQEPLRDAPQSIVCKVPCVDVRLLRSRRPSLLRLPHPLLHRRSHLRRRGRLREHTHRPPGHRGADGTLRPLHRGTLAQTKQRHRQRVPLNGPADRRQLRRREPRRAVQLVARGRRVQREHRQSQRRAEPARGPQHGRPGHSVERIPRVPLEVCVRQQRPGVQLVGFERLVHGLHTTTHAYGELIRSQEPTRAVAQPAKQSARSPPPQRVDAAHRARVRQGLRRDGLRRG